MAARLRKKALSIPIQLKDLLRNHSCQPKLCRYLQENQYLTRAEWAAAWNTRGVICSERGVRAMSCCSFEKYKVL